MEEYLHLNYSISSNNGVKWIDKTVRLYMYNNKRFTGLSFNQVTADVIVFQ